MSISSTSSIDSTTSVSMPSSHDLGTLNIGDRTFEVTIVYRDECGNIVDAPDQTFETEKVKNLAIKLFQEANISDDDNYVILNGYGVHTLENDVTDLYDQQVYSLDKQLEGSLFTTWSDLYNKIITPSYKKFIAEIASTGIAPDKNTQILELYNIKWGNKYRYVNDAYQALEKICRQPNIAKVAARMIDDNDLVLPPIPESLDSDPDDSDPDESDPDEAAVQNIREITYKIDYTKPFTLKDLHRLESEAKNTIHS